MIRNIILTGEFVDTSDKTKKYDIYTFDNDFTDIVKTIEPKTLNMLMKKKKV